MLKGPDLSVVLVTTTATWSRDSHGSFTSSTCFSALFARETLSSLAGRRWVLAA